MSTNMCRYFLVFLFLPLCSGIEIRSHLGETNSKTGLLSEVTKDLATKRVQCIYYFIDDNKEIPISSEFSVPIIIVDASSDRYTCT